MIRQAHRNRRSHGLTLPEVLLLVAICVMVVLFLLMRLPRGREEARTTSCLSNLNQIGQSLAYYVESTGAYPVNDSWTAPNAPSGSSILVKLRDQGDLWGFVDVKNQVEGKSNRKKGEKPAQPAGLRCPSDRSEGSPASSNYRANAGSEPEGRSGPFAIGKGVTPAEVEAADGVAFTAAFAERLIGSGSAGRSPANYFEVDSCGALVREKLVSPGSDPVWKSDTGHDWSRGDWVMGLYHHGMRPGEPVSAVAVKENCGAIGSSSGHTGLVHVLLLDGSARSWRDSVDDKVWRRLGSFRDSQGP